MEYRVCLNLTATAPNVSAMCERLRQVILMLEDGAENVTIMHGTYQNLILLRYDLTRTSQRTPPYDDA